MCPRSGVKTERPVIERRPIAVTTSSSGKVNSATRGGNETALLGPSEQARTERAEIINPSVMLPASPR